MVKEIDPRLRVPGAGIGGFDVPGMGESCFSRDLDIQLDRDVALLWDLRAREGSGYDDDSATAARG